MSFRSLTSKLLAPSKKVLKLEYEAYVPMAIAELKKICDTIRQRWNVIHIVLYHRVGVVPITETSVFVGISSIHRRDSLEACHVRFHHSICSTALRKFV